VQLPGVGRTQGRKEGRSELPRHCSKFKCLLPSGLMEHKDHAGKEQCLKKGSFLPFFLTCNSTHRLHRNRISLITCFHLVGLPSGICLPTRQPIDLRNCTLTVAYRVQQVPPPHKKRNQTTLILTKMSPYM